MRLKNLFSAFKRREDGASAIEFAILVVPFFILFLGVIEFGLIVMTKVVIEAATMQAARAEAVGRATPGCDRVCTVKSSIESNTAGLLHGSNVIVTASVVSGGGQATKTPDFCLDDPQHPYPTTCSGPFEDNDGTAGYQQSTSADAASIGAAGDFVEIRVSYPWRVVIPFFSSYFGENGVLLISSSTVVKNEQF